MAGWIVEVESEVGLLLYAVRTPSPLDAEEIVKKSLNIAPKFLVMVGQPIGDDELDRLQVEVGSLKGPM